MEKANGATTMFNAGMFQYQQALANMQFQQQTAFIPSGEEVVPSSMGSEVQKRLRVFT